MSDVARSSFSSTWTIDGERLASNRHVDVAVCHKGIVGHHVHATTKRVGRQGTADASKADDAEGFSANSVPLP